MHISLSKFFQLRFNVFLYLTFGWNIAKIYIFLFGRLYFFLNSRENGCIKNAISEVIGYKDREANIRVIMKKVLNGILSHYYEKLFIAFEEPEKATKFLKNNIISDDLIVLYRSLLKGNGVIVVTGHYGAIEYIPTMLAVNNFTTSMIAKFKTELLRKKVFSQAKKYNIRLIDAEKTGNVIRAAIKELKENRILITECDEIEEWRASVKEKTSFLGKKTCLDRTINVIQKRTGAEVVFAIIHRYSLSRYKLIMYTYEDMLKMLYGISSSSSVGEAVLKFLEQFIYYHPEQWYQWEKYTEIETITASGLKVEGPRSFPLLKPAFVKIS
jgi:lauroyl/myristoyl acyltransferase